MGIFKSIFSLFIFFFPILSHGAYFQQEVNYTIHVSLDDVEHKLSATETIVYKNNSTKILSEIYFHLWPAAYKDKNTIFAKEVFMAGDARLIAANDSDFGNIDSLSFTVNGENVKWKTLPDTPDVCRIILNRPLASGDSIIIKTPFRVKIPSADFSRLGHNGQAYYITQWFPKPAVYDLDGWNYFPYLDQGEYYNEFGSFDVFITLPENYVLAATGNMVDAADEIKWLEMKDSLTRSTKNFPENDSTPVSSLKIKTIHFRQDNIHDFAWFTDKRWHVLRDTVYFPESNRTVLLGIYFNNKDANIWIKSPSIMRDALKYCSMWIGEYPYDHCSIVDVGYAMTGGMEYPMISTIGSYGDAFDHESTVVHEIAHNWFFGILGTDERCHPWMDEGMTNFIETRYIYTKYINDSLRQEENSGLFGFNDSNRKINHRKKQYYKYLGGARMNTDQPPDLCTDKLSIKNYHADTYYKTALSFDFLKSYLGDSTFDLCMREYFNRWKFKHPQPSDLEDVFESTSRRNLDWIFKDLLQSTKKLDYKFSSITRKNPGEYELTIKNAADVSGPIPFFELKNDSVINMRWIEGFDKKQKLISTCIDCNKFRIDLEERMPEIDQKNNSIRKSGLFRKTEKLKLNLITAYEKSTLTEINFAPIIGWNNYNKFMPGIVLHNISYHEKIFEYRLMPMYSTGTKSIAGGADISYHIYPDMGRLSRITFKGGLSRYAFAYDYDVDDVISPESYLHFTKIDSRIIFSLLPKNRQSQMRNEIMLRNINIQRGLPFWYVNNNNSHDFNYWQFEYKSENLNPLEKSLYKFLFTGNNEFINYTAEMKHFFHFNTAKKGFELRIFGGGYHLSSKTPIANLGYRMSLSGKSGENDYLFDEIFLGRTEESGFLSRQFVNDYAGFKTPTSFYRLADQWMFGINTSINLPGLLPFRIFVNAGLFDNSDLGGMFKTGSYEIGVDLPVIKDIFVIYFPFAYSEDIKFAIESQDLNASDLIRFELHLNKLNPLELIKKAYN